MSEQIRYNKNLEWGIYMNINRLKQKQIPQHLAIILDGNGRWAKKRGLPRTAGHYQGAMNVAKIANACDQLGIKYLTVYAFSTENWKRPSDEVDYLMTMPVKEYPKYKDKILGSNIKIKHVGRKTVLASDVLELINTLEKETNDHTGLTLQIAFDYGSFEEITQAFEKANQMGVKIQNGNDLYPFLYVTTPVDLLIRTSGELRLSNYLLWQASYAEFYFTKVHWPSFNERQLSKAIKTYQKRDRRYGGLNK